MNFKHGDKVTCYIDGEYIYGARIIINESDIPEIQKAISLLQAYGYNVTKIIY